MTGMVIESCDPRDRADQIRALFARNARPEFDAVFERVYRRGAEQGLRSWLGVVGDRVMMHISVSPRVFTNGTRTLRAGILGDLMVDESQRDFWAPLRLLRTVMADVKRAGQVDFVLTTMNPASRSLFKAGGFKPMGQLRRYVFPLFGPYLAVARLRSGAKPCVASPVELGAPEFAARLPGLGSAGLWRAQATPEYYGARIPRQDYADGMWLRVGGSEPAGQGWGLVCRHSTRPELALADAYWTPQGAGPGAIALAAARWGRGHRFSKLVMSTLDQGGVAGQLKRAGFIARPNVMTVLVQSVSQVEFPPVQDWFLTAFVFSTW